jgi:hypothetical protein
VLKQREFSFTAPGDDSRHIISIAGKRPEASQRDSQPNACSISAEEI